MIEEAINNREYLGQSGGKPMKNLCRVSTLF